VCSFKHYCGGCRARADAYYGDPAGADPGCLFNEDMWDQLVAADAQSPSPADIAAG